MLRLYAYYFYISILWTSHLNYRVLFSHFAKVYKKMPIIGI